MILIWLYFLVILYHVSSVPPDFENAWRKFAKDYANHILPGMSDTQHAILNKALNIDEPLPRRLLPHLDHSHLSHPQLMASSQQYYISPDINSCSDSSPGTKEHPWCTLARGVKGCRDGRQKKKQSTVERCTLILRKGTHRLNKTMVLTHADSGLAIVGYPEEIAVISGATLVTTKWEPVSTSSRKCTLFPSSDCTNGHDISGSGVITKTAEECLALCQAKDDCVAGVWGLRADGQHGCYYKTAPAQVIDIGKKKGNTAFNCTPSSFPVWRTKLPSNVKEIRTLLVDGVRAIRARYPNADPETDKYPKGYIRGKTKWLPPKNKGQPTYIEYPDQKRTDFPHLFQTYRAGVGGQCSHFEPPMSYWCAQHPEGGGAAQYKVPSGLQFTKDLLPHAPYKKPVGAIVHAWRPGHWANWMFEVDSQITSNSTLSWSVGGFQGARGNQNGAEWFIDNVMEELDVPREFFFDMDSNFLYYITNTTNIDKRLPSQPSGVFEYALLKTLFDLRGSQDTPVTDVIFSGVTFTGTAHTYMDPHGVPSGGDWALQRAGAIFLEGTEKVVIENCLLTRLDGNAIFLSGYNQYTNISHNEFAYTGDSAMGAWGYTKGNDPNQPEGTGPDGTSGNFPRYTLVEGNFIHHLGIHEKQSSCWFQAKTAETTLQGNLCFEIPRAGFNFNDGFGGGNKIANNLLFNTCGESGDHGAINSWDRQPYLTTIATGKPSLVPAYNEFHHNFIVSNGDADGGAIDNDDGSSYYLEHHNFCVYGGFKAGNFEGHAKKYYSNINAYSHVYGTTCFWNWPGGFPETAFEEQYFNNTCILDANQNYIKMPGHCSWSNVSTVKIIAHNNRVFATNKSANIDGCGKKISFDDWMKLGLDSGTTIGDAVSSQQIIKWATELLGV